MDRNQLQVEVEQIKLRMSLAANNDDLDAICVAIIKLINLFPVDYGVRSLAEQLATRSAEHEVNLRDAYEVHEITFREGDDIQKLKGLMQEMERSGDVVATERIYQELKDIGINDPIIDERRERVKFNPTFKGENNIQIRQLMNSARSALRLGDYDQALANCNEVYHLLDGQEPSPLLIEMQAEAQHMVDFKQNFDEIILLIEEGEWGKAAKKLDDKVYKFGEYFFEFSAKIKALLSKETQLARKARLVGTSTSHLEHINDLQRAVLELPNELTSYTEFASPTERQEKTLSVLSEKLNIIQGRKLGYVIDSIFGEPKQDEQFNCDIFMIMPFADTFTSLYVDHILPLTKSLGLHMKRGDDFFSKNEIMTEIWSAIFMSQIVIADCSGKNANVFYELGIAHTIGRPAILISQNIEDIPFDVQGKRVIVYKNTDAGKLDLQEKLTKAIELLI